MDYPEDFPDDLRTEVEGAIAQAEINLVEVRRKLGPKFEANWQGVLLLWIMTIFFEFTKRACDMGRRGDWSVEKIRVETDSYLKKLATSARSRHAPPSSFSIPYYENQELRKIRDSVTRSDEWEEFQESLKRIIKESANRRLAPLVQAPLVKEFDIGALIAPAMPTDDPSWLGPRHTLRPAPPPSLRERMEKCAAVMGIKTFCQGAGISPASYHKIRHGEGGKAVVAKVESFLEVQVSLENSKKV